MAFNYFLFIEKFHEGFLLATECTQVHEFFLDNSKIIKPSNILFLYQYTCRLIFLLLLFILYVSSQSAKDQRDSYCGAVSAIMTKLGVKESDCDILEVGHSYI